jgi:hypothetical protein
VPITKDHGISNNMKRYSTLKRYRKLADWLEHPDATRYRSQGYFPSRTPTPEQLSAMRCASFARCKTIVA